MEMGWTCDTLQWKKSCQVMLLAAAILSSCFQLTQTQEIPVGTEPSQPLEGEGVILTPGGKADFLVCRWYRGDEAEANRILTYIPSTPEQQNGAAFTGRETAGPGCSLRISHLMLNDSGNYIVAKIMSGATERGQVPIEVLEMLTKPTVSVFPYPHRVEFTDSVTLTCESRSGHAKVHWFKNGSPFERSDHNSLSGDNRTLSIPRVTRNDAGRYQCEVSNSFRTEISDVTYLDVIYGPETPVIHLTEKQKYLRLTCEADTFPDAHYSWFFNGRACGTGSQLLIRDATPENSGNYVCQAMNVLTLQKRNSSTLAVEMEEAQVRDVTVSGPSVAAEDQPVTLTCTAVGSSVSYTWFKGEQRLEPGIHVVLTNNNQNLTLDPSRRSDSGNYTCRASNGNFSSISEPHRLDILYGPDPPIIHEVFDRDRSKLHMSCRADSYPAASYVWFLNGKLLLDEKDTLSWDLSAEYGGSYTCQAENGSTRRRRNTTLELVVLGLDLVQSCVNVSGIPGILCNC